MRLSKRESYRGGLETNSPRPRYKSIQNISKAVRGVSVAYGAVGLLVVSNPPTKTLPLPYRVKGILVWAVISPSLP